MILLVVIAGMLVLLAFWVSLPLPWCSPGHGTRTYCHSFFSFQGCLSAEPEIAGGLPGSACCPMKEGGTAASGQEDFYYCGYFRYGCSS